MLILGTISGVKMYIAIAITPYHQCGDKKNVKTINKNSAKKKSQLINVIHFGVKGHAETKTFLAIM